MAVHAMIDLETLGTKPDCTIISIGAIKFNPYTDNEPYGGLYYKADIDEQSTLGRSVDDATLEWWGKQDAKIRDEALTDGDRTSVDVITNELNIPTIGIGSSLYCDGQILVSEDMLGIFRDNHPKFVKKYADLSKNIRVAVNKYSNEVNNNKFPNKKFRYD